MRVGLSISMRVILNAEALNMAETVGNVNRHRRAPVVLASDEGYLIALVPAISGMSLAHSYMRILTSIADSMNLPVTNMDRMGYYPKFSDNNVIKGFYKDAKNAYNIIINKQNSDPCRVEQAILEDSVVADVTGFLHTNSTTKRTSRIRFSYLIPALDTLAAGAAATQPQIHARYMPKQAQKEQALIDVEQGSGLYALMINLDLTGIGEYSNCEPGSALPNDERIKRAEAATKALVALLLGMDFGAKRSRYEPHWKIMSLAAAVSTGPVIFTASPPHGKDYVKDTVDRAATIAKILNNNRIIIYYYSNENILEPEKPDIETVEVSRAESVTKVIEKAVTAAMDRLKDIIRAQGD